MMNGQLREIRFDDLNDNDTVVVETAHNVYTFRLRDSSNQMGELEGGRFTTPNTAVLGGTMQPDAFLDDRLRVGGRALFFSSASTEEDGFHRIVTSPIARIHVRHDSFDSSRAA